MSTYWYFVCTDHDPELFSDEEFTQHTGDAAYKHAVNLAKKRPVEAATPWDADEYFDRNARRFLLRHPSCEIAIEDEYGVRKSLEEAITDD